MSHREVYTVRLYRENRHVTPPSIGREVWYVVQLATLAFLGLTILVLVMGGF